MAHLCCRSLQCQFHYFGKANQNQCIVLPFDCVLSEGTEVPVERFVIASLRSVYFFINNSNYNNNNNFVGSGTIDMPQENCIVDLIWY